MNRTTVALAAACGSLASLTPIVKADRISDIVPVRLAHNEQGGLRRIVSTTAGGYGCRGSGAWFAPVAGQNLGSTVTGISPDGLVAVGWSLASAPDGSGPVPSSFTWTPCDGEGPIENAPGSVGGQALAASVGGDVVVGIAHGSNDTGFRQFAANAVDLIVDQSAHHATSLRGVSADGDVVVGSGADAIGHQALMFVDGWDHVRSLGDLTGGNAWSDAYGVSANGQVVVGQSFSPMGPQAFVWTDDAGMIGLGDLPGGSFDSAALAVSANGLVIVGVATSAQGPQAFRWTAQSGMVGLGDLPGGAFGSEALAVSADGTVIVGRSLTANGYEAFIWDAASGMRNLRSLIVNRLGVDTDVPLLTAANGISADGTIIGGSAITAGINQGWVSRLPRPLCVADWNHDGLNNSLDYFAFLQSFFAGTADVNGDGTTDTSDFFAFLTAFFTGCQ
ncbi:MAG: GC-type dockerin domain-anchored protein [Phycisphaerales bacterium]